MGDYGLPFMKKTKTLEELQSDNERLRVESENEDLQLSIEQRRLALNKAKEAGLDFRRDFGGSMKKLWKWANK